jgi:hypothetical protein
VRAARDVGQGRSSAAAPAMAFAIGESFSTGNSLLVSENCWVSQRVFWGTQRPLGGRAAAVTTNACGGFQPGLKN